MTIDIAFLLERAVPLAFAASTSLAVCIVVAAVSFAATVAIIGAAYVAALVEYELTNQGAP